MYKGINQYHVVMEVAQQFQQSPDALKNLYVHSTTGQEVPLSAFTHYRVFDDVAGRRAPGAISRRSLFPSIWRRMSRWERRWSRFRMWCARWSCRPRFIPVFKARRKRFRTRWPPSPI